MSQPKPTNQPMNPNQTQTNQPMNEGIESPIIIEPLSVGSISTTEGEQVKWWWYGDIDSYGDVNKSDNVRPNSPRLKYYANERVGATSFTPTKIRQQYILAKQLSRNYVFLESTLLWHFVVIIFTTSTINLLRNENTNEVKNIPYSQSQIERRTLYAGMKFFYVLIEGDEEGYLTQEVKTPVNKVADIKTI